MTACPECNSGEQVAPAMVPGLLNCGKCGLVFPQPDDYRADTDRNLAEQALEPADLVVPDSVEVEIGWRAWGVKPTLAHGRKPVLRSVTHQEAYWTPMIPMQAVCQRSTGRANGVQRKGHEVPDEKCSCGLYSAKTYEHLMSMPYHQYDAEQRGLFHVVGRVKVWGKVIEGTQGWKSTYGYPEALYVPYEAAKELAVPLEQAYGVPVELKNILRREQRTEDANWRSHLAAQITSGGSS